MAVRKVYLTKKTSFEACHYLNNYDGKCSRMHGHSYKLEVTVSGYIDPDYADNSAFCAVEAMVVDFKELKEVINHHVVDKLDHNDLNIYFEQPTAEIMVIWIFDTIANYFKGTDVRVESVKLWETEDSFAEYRGDN